MEQPIFDPIADYAAQANEAMAARNQKGTELGKDDFMMMLVAKLENQDPLNPTADTEFVAQLATFSSLEQLVSVNDNIENMAMGQASLVNSQALNLVGREALVDAGDTIRIRNGEPETLVYALPPEAVSATVNILGPDGLPVRSIDLDTESGGRVTLNWDGTDENGKLLPDGEYTVQIAAIDADGEPTLAGLFKSISIDAVNFNNGGFTLISGDSEIPFDQILEIRAGN